MADNIYKKLANVQQGLFVPKGNRNNFGGYNYRSCEDILKAVKPLLAENGLMLTMSSRTEMVGTWVYVVASCTVFDTESDKSITAEAQAREPEMRKGMDAAQVSGSSLSYARKYALAGLFGIDNEKDPDATNTHGKDNKDPGATNDHGNGNAVKMKVPIEPDYTVCPINDKRFFGKKWESFDQETLKKFLALNNPKITNGHKEQIAMLIKP